MLLSISSQNFLAFHVIYKRRSETVVQCLQESSQCCKAPAMQVFERRIGFHCRQFYLAFVNYACYQLGPSHYLIIPVLISMHFSHQTPNTISRVIYLNSNKAVYDHHQGHAWRMKMNHHCVCLARVCSSETGVSFGRAQAPAPSPTLLIGSLILHCQCLHHL